MNAAHLSTLCDMLSYRRPYGSGAEAMFRLRFLSDLPGIREDVTGNLIVKIGTSPILWSSHTDTVHRTSGFQTVRVNTNEHTIRLSRRSKRRESNCLGADDTVGVFLMREMILRGVPGMYVFHYGEEVGGIGSSAIREYDYADLSHVLFAIALDRRGTSDVVTHQIGGRTASDAFARSLAKQLPGTYAPHDGIFTDTANYADIIPECTNVSVGYYHEHSTAEYVDYAHVGRLLEALCTVNSDLLTCERNPYMKETRTEPKRFYDRDTSRFDLPLWTRKSSDYYGRLADYSPVVCGMCGLPILSKEDDYPADDDFCTCEDEHGLSADDLKFLHYLRGLRS